MSDLPKKELCIHKPEPNWFDIREAINKMLREERTKEKTKDEH